MAITKADVVAIAPELSAVGDSTFNIYLADAALIRDLKGLSSQEGRDYVLKNLTAFLMVEDGHGTQASARGDVTSESVGDVSRSYARPGGSSGGTRGNSDLERNRYGRNALRYLRRFGARAYGAGL